MILDASKLINDFNSVIPFLKNGILIDTSVMYVFIDGHISAQYAKQVIPGHTALLDFFDLIKVSNKWNKFVITPHIFTEVCNHFRKNYRKRYNYKELTEDIIPILGDMKECGGILKSEIIEHIDKKNPVIEVGDISIYIAADKLTEDRNKMAILANDSGYNSRYVDNLDVMVMDYNNIILNLS